MDSLSHAEWFLQHKRRAPLSLVVFLGAGLSIYVALVGAGRSAACERLVESSRALVAMQPAPLPDARNAALQWRNAFRAHVRWTGGTKDPTWSSNKDPLDFSPNSPARVHLAANAALLAAADQAADLPECNWDLDYSKGVDLPLPHLGPLRECARICALRAKVAAADNDWPTVLRSMKTMTTAAEHARKSPMLIPLLVQIAIDSIAAGSVQDALNTPGARPGKENLKELIAIIQSRHDVEIGYAETIRTERKFSFHISDQMGAGEAQSLAAMGINLPHSESMLFNFYSALCASDQTYANRVFERLAAAASESEKTARPSSIITPELLEAETGAARQRFFILSYSLIPVMSRISESVIRRKLSFRTMIVGISALQYRHENQRWPAQLNDLMLDPRFLLDPSDTKTGTLKCRVDPDNSFWVWSVGTDGVDDGSAGGFEKRKTLMSFSAWNESDCIFHVRRSNLNERSDF